FLTVEDLYGQFEVIVFPNVLESQAAMLVRDTAVWVEGRASVKEDEEPKILAERFLALTADGVLPGLPGRGRNGVGRGFRKPTPPAASQMTPPAPSALPDAPYGAAAVQAAGPSDTVKQADASSRAPV